MIRLGFIARTHATQETIACSYAKYTRALGRGLKFQFADHWARPLAIAQLVERRTVEVNISSDP